MVARVIWSGGKRDGAAITERALRGVTALAALGVGEGDVVAIMLRNEIAFLEAMLMARQAGCYSCPINWHYKADEAGYILRDCGAKALIVHADLLQPIEGGVPRDVHVIAVAPPPELRAAFRLAPEQCRVPAGVIEYESWLAAAARYDGPPRQVRGSLPYSSGTTGRPKGVKRHAPPPDEVKQRYDLASVTFVASTGSPCPPEVKKQMIDWWGPVINESYASSEAGFITMLSSEESRMHPGSAGRPLAGADVRIMDDSGRLLPPYEAGLIYCRQEAYPDFTYINRPEDRKAIDRDGLVAVGDVGYFDRDGYLYICDRKSDMVISGGVNIYPAEIEAVLITMPQVADCAVFGIPDAEFGEALAAHVQPHDGAALEREAVGNFLRERIADYKVPRVIEFSDALPREESGKIFKQRLRDPYWQEAGRRI